MQRKTNEMQGQRNAMQDNGMGRKTRPMLDEQRIYLRRTEARLNRDETECANKFL